MVRPLHGEWHGFKAVQSDNKRKAECQKCGRLLAKISSTSLSTHRKICSGRTLETVSSNATSTSESRQNSCISNATNCEKNASNQMLQTSANQMLQTDSFTAEESEVSFSGSASKKAKVKLDFNKVLLELLASLDLDFNIIECLPFVKFVRKLAPDYDLPSLQELKSTAINEVYSSCFGTQHQLSASFLMGACTVENDQEFYSVSFIIKNEKYFYIDSKKLVYGSTDSVNAQLEEFIEQSIKICITVHKAAIKYFILDSNIVVKDKFTVIVTVDDIINQYSVYLFNSFRLTIDNLRYKVNTVMDGYEQCIVHVDNLSRKIRDKEYCLSDAVNDLFILYNDVKIFPDIEAIVSEEMSYFLKPVVLASNYFDHKYGGQQFVTLNPYGQDMYIFLYDVIPEDATVAFSLYMTNAAPFCNETFKNANVRFTKMKFWSLVEGQKVNDEECNLKALSSFAKTFINLPSVIKPIKTDILSYIFTAKSKNCNLITSIVGCSVLNN